MKIKLSKSQWNFIGRKASWIKKASDLPDVNKTDSKEIDDNSKLYIPKDKKTLI